MTLLARSILLILAACAVMVEMARADDAPAPPDPGLMVYRSANCVGCHQWFGKGGGGYGGDAANLRITSLTVEQIREVVKCGRPYTGMPHFDRDAYLDGRCYGLKSSDLKRGELREPNRFLRPAEIDAVADYIVRRVKGRGDPTFEECQAFFGTATHACNTYPHAAPGSADATPGNGHGGTP